MRFYLLILFLLSIGGVCAQTIPGLPYSISKKVPQTTDFLIMPSVDAEKEITKNEQAEITSREKIQQYGKALDVNIDVLKAAKIDTLPNGELVYQETRGFDALKGITIGMRSKEAANDYRYFPEPDLQPLFIDQSQIQAIKLEMPALPRDLYIKYTESLGLSEYDANILVDNKQVALYYEEVLKYTSLAKSAANIIMGEVKGYLNHYMIEITEFPISAEKIALLVELIESGKISYSIAATKIFPVLIENPMKLPLQIAEELNVIQDSDETTLASYVLNVIDENPLEIDRYKNGEKQLLGFLMGKLMKISNGKADPKQANPLLRKMLDELI